MKLPIIAALSISVSTLSGGAKPASNEAIVEIAPENREIPHWNGLAASSDAPLPPLPIIWSSQRLPEGIINSGKPNQAVLIDASFLLLPPTATYEFFVL